MGGTVTTYHSAPSAIGVSRRDSDVATESTEAIAGEPAATAFFGFNPFLLLGIIHGLWRYWLHTAYLAVSRLLLSCSGYACRHNAYVILR